MESRPATGRFRKFLPESKYGKSFLIITILESCIDIILEAIVIARLNLIHSLKISLDDITATRTPLVVYLGIFILAHLFQLYFALDALRHKNTIQLIGLCCFNFAFLVYAIIQVPEIREIELAKGIDSNSSTPAVILLIIPACIGTCQVAFVYLTWHLFKEFGWQIYKQIGADRKIKRVYLWYQIFMCLLKFDYFFFMAFTVQLVLLVPSVSPLERVLTVIALPATLLLLVVGYYGVRKEIKSVILLFMIGLLSGSSYFIYKLYRIWEGRHDANSYENVFKSLTVFSVSCLTMTLMSFTSAIICLFNFGKGLKAQIDKNSNTKKTTGRRRVAAERVYNEDEGMVDELGRRYDRTGSGTSLGLDKSTCKAGLEVSGIIHEQPQKLSTFKSNEINFDDPVGGYFSTNLDFNLHPSSDPPPPPSPFDPSHLTPTPPSASHNLHIPSPPSATTKSRLHHPYHLGSKSQRRQNSNDESNKRMSID
ncbi:hypothetical protein MJO28_005426 [Puccinia striiformis f. sp. tritici]|uniref:Uncharacterized protein n=2 Tax=Puccinia striiformis f. sp. tritici TaxID=168172 RepID=A0A0L0VGE6_9BASI|nr:hypothetical protein Pst134EA_009585 [Puccinia striiformis f. sp. tritici]KAI9621457.1 hypothetical protein H4Q26_015760 [Puccinia striiformis f. sp. tritici PST-130]KNE98318.1 hypothetical protein PSTG_08394 [Puccinia striiformis f. sp. tritici PST-78]KAH9458355.1 hypothetical protein Pst134EB_010659 [Puccinia striiformis f. sp. tritici]KAH9469062.1 hypothetical protein Pst134EA_009585 [Puccinia striiformis f. sp. tritici]KAI7955026.1 hypothetical protein MJO28_005426 [Puccinia striiformis